MADLSTTYLGKKLKNPVIVGANEYTANMDKIKQIEQAGAGALVIKSLFEEQIQLESLKLQEDLSKFAELNAEMTSIFPDLKHAGPEEHLMWVRKAKESVAIPVFASLNAINPETWLEYSELLAQTGVDGLELNFYAVPVDFEKSAGEIETEQIKIIREIKSRVKLPISVKLSPFYTNPLHFIARLDQEKVDGLVLFNQLFQPDINPVKEKHIFPFNLSEKKDQRLPLRFSGLLSGNVQADICASTGIFDGADVAKMLLAGADVVQIVSTLYRNSIDHISLILKDLEKWMNEKGYTRLDDFVGKLSQQNSQDLWAYRRAQYVKLLLRSNPLAD
jgi:dihydroorotate dehydrogenase (fumarate)